MTSPQKEAASLPGGGKLALTNVRVFDGRQLIPAGTDANDSPGTPSPVPHGDSLHRELELLADAGLSPLDALRAATSRPARYFGLPDRGSVEPGLRADLVLIEDDPLADIRATRSIRRIWCGGYEVQPARTGN